jgi:hypothetical protein
MRVRLVAVVVLAVVALGVGTGAAGGNLASTVTVDLSASQGAFPFALGGQLSATPNSWNYGSSTMDELNALRLQRTRVWLKFNDSSDQSSYLATYSSLASSLLVNWQSGYDTLIGNGWTADQIFAAERDELADYKSRYPKIQYLEVENEAIPTTADIPAYYLKYQLMYKVVNAVNAPLGDSPRGRCT